MPWQEARRHAHVPESPSGGLATPSQERRGVYASSNPLRYGEPRIAYYAYTNTFAFTGWGTSRSAGRGTSIPAPTWLRLQEAECILTMINVYVNVTVHWEWTMQHTALSASAGNAKPGTEQEPRPRWAAVAALGQRARRAHAASLRGRSGGQARPAQRHRAELVHLQRRAHRGAGCGGPAHRAHRPGRALPAQRGQLSRGHRRVAGHAPPAVY